MGSASRILTVVVELGLVMTIAGMLYGSSAPSLANINPPTFDNPFDHGVTVSLGLGPPWGNNYTSSPGNVTAFSNESGSVRCTNATMYACLDDPQNANNGTTRSDGNFTYVHLNHGFAIRLNLTGNLAQGQVKNGQVRFWCRAFDDPDFFTQTGCQISQFIDSLINWIQWIGAGLRFIFSWGGQFIVFLMSVISLFLWLYAIPQLPGPIQLVFSVWVTGNLIYLVYTIAATLRGFPAE